MRTAPIYLQIPIFLALLLAWACPAVGAPERFEKGDNLDALPEDLFRGTLICADSVEADCDFLYYGTTINGINSAQLYSCNPFLWETGPELVFELVLTQQREVIINLAPDDCDLDIFLLGECDEDSCIASSISSGDEHIIECIEAGTYYIAVDGYNSAACSLAISVFCHGCASDVDPIDIAAEETVLHPCRPNPFGLATMIRFDLPSAGSVDLSVSDISGRRVRSLIDDHYEAGAHRAIWDGLDDSGREAATGIYFYRLRVNGEMIATQKAIVLR